MTVHVCVYRMCIITEVAIFILSLQATSSSLLQCWYSPYCILLSLLVPKVWQRYLHMLVQQHNLQPCHSVTPTNVLGSCPAMEIFNPLLPLLPEVILWEPASQYPCIFPSGIAYPFSECNEVLNVHHWNIGQNECSQPRLLYSASKPILLVSGVYRCKNGHQILSHDTQLLQLFSSHHTFPFILTRKSAFVSELVRLCLWLDIECIFSRLKQWLESKEQRVSIIKFYKHFRIQSVI